MSDIVRTWRHIQQRYNLVGSKCTTCGKVYFPPRVICPVCRRKGNIETIQFKGTGKVHSFSIVHAATDDFKKLSPYAVAIIELDEGAKITSQIIDSDLEDIQIGDPVEMVFRKIREDGEDGVISYGFKFKTTK
ncbi:Zn-ribbon domain-containing OB-fold protein [Methanobrevibacter filiformis]|uniref:DUF35 domain-containing protein n=1 Tax=Methanobrevibacter filiformis TaxID=55758 RepID=A0A162FI48_9EURY|nr:Zn-ribbon domain-containing OB-fold protein [Methanobrevibacter filiformis]KZX10310.1 hypothetical protein MBFIL_18080 [Methanobrevibacter filiformis]